MAFLLEEGRATVIGVASLPDASTPPACGITSARKKLKDRQGVGGPRSRRLLVAGAEPGAVGCPRAQPGEAPVAPAVGATPGAAGAEPGAVGCPRDQPGEAPVAPAVGATPGAAGASRPALARSQASQLSPGHELLRASVRFFPAKGIPESAGGLVQVPERTGRGNARGTAREFLALCRSRPRPSPGRHRMGAKGR